MNRHSKSYISKHIQSVYRRHLVSPILYLCILILMWLIFPLYDILSPQEFSNSEDLSAYKNSYMETTLKDLYFTGYTNTFLGKTIGYYYYTLQNQQCIFVLLSPSTCEEGLPVIESAHIRGKILKGNQAFYILLEQLAKDLNWTKNDISNSVNPYFISEPAFKPLLSTFLMFTYFFTGAYACLRIFLNFIYIIFPVLSPICRRLRRFGKVKELLMQAEAELDALPKLAKEDMFITEHYFIVLADYKAAILPIQEIVWIYKYSTLHKILWYHFNISYTLHIIANKHLYVHCPKNMKSDVDEIIDYLAEANPDILVGFNEENRKKALLKKSFDP